MISRGIVNLPTVNVIGHKSTTVWSEPSTDVCVVLMFQMSSTLQMWALSSPWLNIQAVCQKIWAWFSKFSVTHTREQHEPDSSVLGTKRYFWICFEKIDFARLFELGSFLHFSDAPKWFYCDQAFIIGVVLILLNAYIHSDLSFCSL